MHMVLDRIDTFIYVVHKIFAKCVKVDF